MASPSEAEELLRYRPADPFLFVIFGATGDLSRRKLLPALYNLAAQRLLPEGFVLVGAARDDLRSEEFQAMVERSVREHSRLQPVDEVVLRWLLQNLDYQPLDFRDETGFRRLERRLDDLERERPHAHRVYYCATPPATFSVIVRGLDDAGMARGADPGQRRIMVDMDFTYRRAFGDGVADAYEHLLIDCMRGDPTYFVRSDEVEATWALIDPIEERWAYGYAPLGTYPAGSWGPAAADDLLARDWRRWHDV